MKLWYSANGIVDYDSLELNVNLTIYTDLFF